MCMLLWKRWLMKGQGSWWHNCRYVDHREAEGDQMLFHRKSTKTCIISPLHSSHGLQSSFSRNTCASPVLHKPISLSFICSIANSQHTMVQVCLWAEDTVIHPRPVQLEGDVAGINGNRDRSSCCHSSLQVSLTLGLDIHKSSVICTNTGSVELAFLILNQNKWSSRGGMWKTGYLMHATSGKMQHRLKTNCNNQLTLEGQKKGLCLGFGKLVKASLKDCCWMYATCGILIKVYWNIWPKRKW